MNALDFIFNGDHAADGAYGTAYIGLDSPIQSSPGFLRTKNQVDGL